MRALATMPSAVVHAPDMHACCQSQTMLSSCAAEQSVGGRQARGGTLQLLLQLHSHHHGLSSSDRCLHAPEAVRCGHASGTGCAGTASGSQLILSIANLPEIEPLLPPTSTIAQTGRPPTCTCADAASSLSRAAGKGLHHAPCSESVDKQDCPRRSNYAVEMQRSSVRRAVG